MATSGALGPFLDAMLKLRAQRMQEEQAQEASLQAGVQGLTSGITSAAGSIMGGMAGGQQAGMMNTAMNTAMPPRATAVGPNAGALNAQAAASPLAGQIPYSQVPVTMQPHTGGAAEMKMLQGMGQMQAAKPGDLMAQMRLQQGQDRLDMQARAAEESKTNEIFNRKTEEADKIYKDSLAYISGSQALLEKMSGAKDRATYNSLANQLRATNSMAQGRKLQVPLVSIPGYQDPEAQKIQRELTAAQAAMQGVKPDAWGYGAERTELARTEAKAEGGMSMRGDMPEAAPQGPPPGSMPLPPGAARIPDGAIATGKDGKKYKKQGGVLVPIQ